MFTRGIFSRGSFHQRGIKYMRFHTFFIYENVMKMSLIETENMMIHTFRQYFREQICLVIS